MRCVNNLTERSYDSAVRTSLRGCEEPRRPSPLVGDDGTDLYDGVRPPDPVPGSPPNIWSLHAPATAATNAAWRGKPAAIIWHVQLSAE